MIRISYLKCWIVYGFNCYHQIPLVIINHLYMQKILIYKATAVEYIIPILFKYVFFSNFFTPYVIVAVKSLMYMRITYDRMNAYNVYIYICLYIIII